MSIKNDILWRIYISFFLLCIVAVVLVIQAFRIQVSQGEHYRALADSLTTSYRTIPAERGNIYSADNKLLATSLPFFELRMDVNTEALTDEIFYENIDSLSWHLTNYFNDYPSSEYRRRLVNARNQGNRYLLIKRKVTYPQLQEIKTWPLFRLGQYKGGFIVKQTNKRSLPFGMLAHRTIGYVRTGPGSQSVGLEAMFNETLSGKDGKRLMQKIAGNHWMPINDDNEIQPINGNDLITTIDINIQDVAEYALLKALNKHKAHHGSAIVMEVETGKIKAIANLGRDGSSGYFEKYNYAIGESSEPGSTFKLATIMALMEDGLIDLEDSVDIENGTTRFYNRTMRDAEKHGEGNMTIRHAFEVSSNVGLSKLADEFYGKNPDPYVKRLREFHLHEVAGIEIKGEPNPVIKSPGDSLWSGVTIPWMSVGYEIQMTPLQTLTFYNAVANNGRLMKPYLVSEVRRYGRPVQMYFPEVVDKRIASKKTITKARELLEGVVEHGTAKNLKGPGYKIAGKTGTAQIADKNRGYQKVYQSSFVGYFPAENPQYSCIVVINSPSAGFYYGSSVAAPVFKEVADKIYASKLERERSEEIISEDDQVPVFNKGYKHDFDIIYQELDYQYNENDSAEWTYINLVESEPAFQTVKVRPGLVPSVKGMGLRDAIYVLENQGMTVKVIGRGKVYSQSISAGSRSFTGQQITLKLK